MNDEIQVATAIKERERNNWASAAEGWRRRDNILRKGAAPVTKRMLELSEITSGARVLDIASGTGEPAITAAKIVGDSGMVIGTDLVDEMLMVAREKAEKEGLSNIDFHCIDAEKLIYTDGSFDAVTLRWGLMFMPQPQDCLASAYRVLKQGGRIALACWSAQEKNPFVDVLLKTLEKYIDVPSSPPGSPGIFAFADRERLRGVLVDAGFSNIVLEEMAIDVIKVNDGFTYWEVISDLAAPVMALVGKLEDSMRSDYIDEVIRISDTMKKDGTLCMKGTTWIASASK